MIYIQFKYAGQLETVDQFETWKEASAMLREYRMVGSGGEYYLSTRACKAWRESS